MTEDAGVAGSVAGGMVAAAGTGENVVPLSAGAAMRMVVNTILECD